MQHLPLLISCLHLGHFFPYLSAADHKHFLQKSIGPFTSKSTKAKQGESVVSGNSSGFDHHRVFIHSATARRAYPQEQNHIRSTEQGKSVTCKRNQTRNEGGKDVGYKNEVGKVAIEKEMQGIVDTYMTYFRNGWMKGPQTNIVVEAARGVHRQKQIMCTNKEKILTTTSMSNQLRN